MLHSTDAALKLAPHLYASGRYRDFLPRWDAVFFPFPFPSTSLFTPLPALLPPGAFFFALNVCPWPWNFGLVSSSATFSPASPLLRKGLISYPKNSFPGGRRSGCG